MDNPQLIALDDVVLRDDLDPRLGDRDDALIAQYADIFDALPPIEINQHNELIDGWHRVRAAKHAKKTEIAYLVVETKDDEDLADKMWDANLQARCSVHPRSAPNPRTEIARARLIRRKRLQTGWVSALARCTGGQKSIARKSSKNVTVKSNACAKKA